MRPSGWHKPKKWGWYKKRSYPHFDLPLSADKAKAYVTDPGKVARHSFYPFLSFNISKRRFRKQGGKVKISQKVRPIRIPAHVDGYIFAYYAKELATAYESAIRGTDLQRSVIAYRKGLGCNIDLAQTAFDEIERRGSCSAVAIDIEAFFDSIDHEVLKQSWCSLLGTSTLPPDHFAVYRAITRYARVDKEECYRRLGIPLNGKEPPLRLCSAREFREKIRGDRSSYANLIVTHDQPFGIPQGSQISAVLSNIYMLQFDRAMCSLSASIDAYYRLYSDDILWICDHKDVTLVQNETEKFLRQLGGSIKINKAKTVISTYRRTSSGELICAGRPLQYLGFEFDGTERLLRSSTLSRFWRRVVFGVRSAKRDAHKAAQAGGKLVVFKRSIYRRFTHLGRSNFITYALRSAKMTKGKGIRKQIARHWDRVQAEIRKPLKP